MSPRLRRLGTPQDRTRDWCSTAGPSCLRCRWPEGVHPVRMRQPRFCPSGRPAHRTVSTWLHPRDGHVRPHSRSRANGHQVRTRTRRASPVLRRARAVQPTLDSPHPRYPPPQMAAHRRQRQGPHPEKRAGARAGGVGRVEGRATVMRGVGTSCDTSQNASTSGSEVVARSASFGENPALRMGNDRELFPRTRIPQGDLAGPKEPIARAAGHPARIGGRRQRRNACRKCPVSAGAVASHVLAVPSRLAVDNGLAVRRVAHAEDAGEVPAERRHSASSLRYPTTSPCGR